MVDWALKINYLYLYLIIIMIIIIIIIIYAIISITIVIIELNIMLQGPADASFASATKHATELCESVCVCARARVLFIF